MTNQQAEQKLAKAYQSVGGRLQGIDWQAILRMIMEMLSGCTIANAKAFGKAHPLALQFLLNRRLHEEEMAMPSKDRKFVAQAGVKAFNAAKASDIEDLTT